MTATCHSGKLLAIDPGNPTSTLAWYAGGRLVGLGEYAGTLRPLVGVTDLHGMPGEPNLIAIERPVIYPGGHRRPNDIVGLAWSGALCLGAMIALYRCPHREYEPRTWKGQTPKPVSHARLWAQLSEAERALFPAGTAERIQKACLALGQTGKVTGYSAKVHNSLDAAALGAFVLGRTK